MEDVSRHIALWWVLIDSGSLLGSLIIVINANSFMVQAVMDAFNASDADGRERYSPILINEFQVFAWEAITWLNLSSSNIFNGQISIRP